MRNAAGDENCDEYLQLELKEAEIEVMWLPFASEQEVPSRIVGFLNGWSFRRAWYYWVAKAEAGVCLPFDIAEELHRTHGKEIRVSGHCLSPSPKEWYKEPYYIGVPLYHVDTQEGLNALARAIKSASN